jgi:hypothetical protein
MLTKEFGLKEGRGNTRVRVAQHYRLLEVAADVAIDLGEHGAVHLHP